MTVLSTKLFHKTSVLAVHIAMQKQRRGVKNATFAFMSSVLVKYAVLGMNIENKLVFLFIGVFMGRKKDDGYPNNMTVAKV